MPGPEDDEQQIETEEGSAPRARVHLLDRSELEPGALLGDRVRLLRRLATGGMADLWVGEHLTLGLDVAVKLLRYPGDRTMRERLAREAHVATQLHHPNAVRILDHGTAEDGSPFIVMELLDGSRWPTASPAPGRFPSTRCGSWCRSSPGCSRPPTRSASSTATSSPTT